jgi:Flp pilus assembly CpaE family ATPase
VGTTTIALNLAAALFISGESPIAVDFRLGSGSMGLFLGLDNSSGITNILSKPAPEIRPGTIEKELAIHPSGLRSLLASARPKEAQIKFPIESALAAIATLRALSPQTVYDLGHPYDNVVSRLQREMDQIVLVVEPVDVALKMAQRLLQEMESGGAGGGRIHIVVVNRAQTDMQTPWNEVEHILGRDLRAIISAAPELAYQAARAAMPIVMFQQNSIVSNQLMKLAEDLNARVRSTVNSQFTT